MKKSRKTPVPDIHPEEVIRILGYNLEELRSSSKERHLADKRRVVAAILQWLGMAEWHIGDVLNRKRVTVSAMICTLHLVEDEIRKAKDIIKNSDYGKEKEEELRY